jgi:hypothetical protein
MDCSRIPEKLHLFIASHDVDERDAIRQAQPAQHLSDIRCRSRVHKSGVSLALHSVNHRKNGNRVDGCGCASPRAHSFGQNETIRGAYRAIFAEHTIAQRHGSPNQMLDARPGFHNDAGALISNRQRAVQTWSDAGVPFRSSNSIDPRSAGPNINRRSAGLIGAASTRTRISPASGKTTSCRAKLSSNSPSDVIIDRSSIPDVALDIDVILRFLGVRQPLQEQIQDAAGE